MTDERGRILGRRSFNKAVAGSVLGAGLASRVQKGRAQDDTVRVLVGSGENGFKFCPENVTVETGTTVVWEWTGRGGQHHVVEQIDGQPFPDNPDFESELVAQEGHEFTHTFDEPGTYDYSCPVHLAQDMVGTIEVVDRPVDDPTGASSCGSNSNTGQNEELLYENQLIARWSFQNGFQDTVGNMDANAAYGSPTVGTYNGRSGVRFDGNDGLMVGNGSENPELSFVEQDDGPVSIGGWAYFDQETGGRQRGEYAEHHILRNDGEYVLEAHPDTGSSDTVELRFGIGGYAGGVSYNTRDQVEEQLDVPIQEWHHFFVVLNPSEHIRFYLNGERVFTDQSMDGYSPPVTNYWSHQTIGSWYGTNNPNWYNLMRGKLSDLRIYDTELSPDEVAQIYTNTGGSSGEANTGTGGIAGGTSTDGNTNSLSQDTTDGTRQEPGETPDDTGVLDGFATMFREPSESAGLWGLLLGGGVLGSGYLAYRRRDSDDEEDKAVAKECPECGSRVDATNDFCGNCGAQVDGNEKEDRQKTESAETVNVSSYEEFSTGEVVETGSGYQVQEANLDSSERSVWVVTPSAEGGQTLNVSKTESFLEDMEPWTKMDNHPNLLQIYGHGTEPLPWLATETGDYPHILGVADELSVEEKIEVVSQVCEAVHHVHRYGITYQNLSIDSVTVTDGTKVKLRGPLDYLNGTSDSEVTEQRVIYSIGNIAKELLTGPSATDVSDEIWQKIDKAISEDPSDRYETILHLRDSLTGVYK